MPRVLTLFLALLLANISFAADPKQPDKAVEPSLDGRTLSDWVKQLKEGKTTEERTTATKKIGSIGPSLPALQALIAALDDPKSDVRIEALHAFVTIGPGTAPILVQIIRGDDTKLVPPAIRALCEMGPSARSAAVPLVRGLLPDIDNSIRERVVAALVRLDNRDAIPVLVPLLTHNDPLTKLCAGRALAGLEAETAAVLAMYAELAKSDIRGLRLFVANDLRTFGPEAEAAIPTLLKLLADEEPPIREQAAVALGRVGPLAKKAAAEKLTAVMNDDKEAFVRIAAANAAWRISRDPGAAATFRDLLNHESAFLQLRAAQGLWHVQPGDDVVKKLREHAEKENQIGELAVLMLGQIGPDAAESAGEVAGHLTEPGKPLVAALALERFGPKAKKYLPQLTELAARGNDPAARAAAAVAAWRIGGDPNSLDALKPLLEDKSVQTRREAARAAVNASPLPESFIPTLTKALDSTDSMVRMTIAEALRWSGESEVARIALTKLLRDPDADVRYTVSSQIGMLGADGRPAVKELCRLLWDPNNQNHGSAAEALGRIGPAAKSSVPDLITRLQTHEDPTQTYSAVCEALGLIGKDAVEAVPLLKTLLDHPRPYVRVNAAYALWRIAGSKDGEKVLTPALRNRTGAVRGYAAEALWFIRKDPESIPELLRLLDQAEPETLNERFIAARALGRIGKDAKAALPLLKRAKKSSDPDLRRTAEETIRLIEK